MGDLKGSPRKNFSVAGPLRVELGGLGTDPDHRICLSVHQSTSLSSLPVYLSTCLLVYLSTCLPVYLSNFLPVYLSTSPPFYLSTSFSGNKRKV